MTHGNPREFKPSVQALRLVFCLALIFSVAGVSQAQNQHYLIPGNAPPGLTAQKKLIENPSLALHSQAVEVITPQGSLISMWSSQGYSAAHDSRVHVGLSIGQVYRMKVSNIPRFPDYEVYPSIEVIDRLNPPEGMENQFPIKIVLNADDLEKALRGKLVTKVIYLEDPKTSLPYRLKQDDQPYFDIGVREDPLQTAAGMGRPMAIVRLGSRVPTFDDPARRGEFDFFSQPPQELPPPQPPIPEIEVLRDVKADDRPPGVPERNLPPIVPGNDFRQQENLNK